MSILDNVNNIIENFLSSLLLLPETYKFMFPNNIDLNKLSKAVNDGTFPTIPSLAPAITNCIILSILRYILHVTLFENMALYAMKYTKKSLTPDTIIEKHLPDKGKKIDDSLIDKLVETLNDKKYNKDYISNYTWDRYRNSMINKKVVKFVEALWRFIFYTVFSVVGYRTLFLPKTVDWIIDTKEHWKGWPLDHKLNDAIKLYYHVELGRYYYYPLLLLLLLSHYYYLFITLLLLLLLLLLSL